MARTLSGGETPVELIAPARLGSHSVWQWWMPSCLP